MKDEYTAHDFARGRRNPYFEKLNKKTEVAIRHETYQIYKDIAEKNGIEPELVMRRALEQFAGFTQMMLSDGNETRKVKATIDCIADIGKITIDAMANTKDERLTSEYTKFAINAASEVAKHAVDN